MRFPSAGRQNKNFIASWPTRALRAEVTKPKVALVTLPLGLLNCVWLKTLKNSKRNCVIFDSVMRMSFNSAMSKAVQARSVEEALVAGSKLPNIVPAEYGLVEVRQPGTRVVHSQLQVAAD